MNTENKIEYQSYTTAGERLSHILDQVRFKKGRGRVKNFHLYLMAQQPSFFGELKYTTVRSWFQDSAPQMSKIDVIISLLQQSYAFHHNISYIKTWWKVGGLYPFVDMLDNATPTLLDLKQDISDNIEKTHFVIISLVTEITNDYFKSLTSKDLVRIKDKAVKLVNDFSDPFKTECPSEYIKLTIKHELLKILDERSLNPDDFK